MSTFLSRLMSAQVAWGEYAEDTFTARFLVVSRKIEPRFPYFVGRIREGAYYISDEVPPEFRGAVIAYEHFFYAEQDGNDVRSWQCLGAVQEELKRVDKIDLMRYLEMRLKFFDALIEKHSHNRDYLRELRHARNYVQDYLCGLGWKG